MDAEGAMGVERSTRRARIFGDQFEIRKGGHQRDHEGDQERHPHRAADLVGDLSRQRINAGAENVAHDEQQKQPRPHHTLQFGLG